MDQKLLALSTRASALNDHTHAVDGRIRDRGSPRLPSGKEDSIEQVVFDLLLELRTAELQRMRRNANHKREPVPPPLLTIDQSLLLWFLQFVYDTGLANDHRQNYAMLVDLSLEKVRPLPRIHVSEFAPVFAKHGVLVHGKTMALWIKRLAPDVVMQFTTNTMMKIQALIQQHLSLYCCRPPPGKHTIASILYDANVIHDLMPCFRPFVNSHIETAGWFLIPADIFFRGAVHPESRQRTVKYRRVSTAEYETVCKEIRNTAVGHFLSLGRGEAARGGTVRQDGVEPLYGMRPLYATDALLSQRMPTLCTMWWTNTVLGKPIAAPPNVPLSLCVVESKDRPDQPPTVPIELGWRSCV